MSKEPSPSGYVVALPIEANVYWISDIVNLSEGEFVTWLKLVCPIHPSLYDGSSFADKASRVQTLEGVVELYRVGLFNIKQGNQ